MERLWFTDWFDIGDIPHSSPRSMSLKVMVPAYLSLMLNAVLHSKQSYGSVELLASCHRGICSVPHNLNVLVTRVICGQRASAELAVEHADVGRAAQLHYSPEFQP